MPDGVQPSDGAGSEPKAKFAAFVAYNSQDEAAARCAEWISEALESHDLPAWLADRDVPEGAKSISESMERGIAESECCLVLLGPMGFGKWQGRFELEVAIGRSVQEDDFRVVVVRLPGSPAPDTLRVALTKTAIVDLTQHVTPQGLTEEGLNKVVRAVRQMTPREFEEELARAAAAHAKPAFRALLVGISQYESAELRTLKGPPNDVTKLAAALAEVGAPGDERWEIAQCREPGREELGTTVRNFLSRAGEGDTLLFYYSGHGLIEEGDSYICTGKTQPKDPYPESLAAAEIALWLKRSPAGGIVVILDCCRGATIDASAYDETRDSVAVILASRGQAADAESENDPSPFTRQLISEIRDPLAHGDGALTVGELLTGLGQRGYRAVTNARPSTSIELVRRAPEPIVPARVETAPALALVVKADCVAQDRLPMVRQLAATLDGLLAAEHVPDRVPSALITETMQMLARELRAGLTHRDQHSLEQALRDESPSTCSIRFADRAAAAQLGDLPWEYLTLYVDPQQGADDEQGLSRSPAMVVERQLEVSPGPKGESVTVQRVELFSSLVSAEEGALHPLTAATKAQLEGHGIPMQPEISSSWNVFSMARGVADVVILQCGVRLQGKRLEVLFAPEAGGTALVPAPHDTLAKKLKDRSAMTTLLIETIADDSTDQPALALRRLARGLTESLRCPVVAICHSRAYAHCPKHHPTEPVFMAALLQAVRSRLPLDQAALTARNEVVTSLVTDPALVGIPIVMMPKKPEQPRTRRDEHPRRGPAPPPK